MLKVTGVVESGYEVLDTEDGVTEIATAAELVLALSEGVVFDNCEYGPKGLIITLEGQEPFDVEVEVWKPVWFEKNGKVIYADNYEVSNLGRVRSVRFIGEYRRWKIFYLHPHLGQQGYCECFVSMNSKQYNILIHRLVALSFLVNPHSFPIINHKDEIKVHNWASNLEWCTYAYNNAYGKRQQFFKECSRAVRRYSLSGEVLDEYESMEKAARVFDCASATIRGACTGRSQTALGFVWRYVADDELFDLSELRRASIISSFYVTNHVVRQYSLSGVFIAEYKNPVEAAKGFGGGRANSCVAQCCRREYWTAYGYIWRYISDDEFADRPENKAAIAAFHAGGK